MAVRPVIQGESEELRKVCTRVIHFDQTVCCLIEDLVDTMRSEHVLALSAPQVGASVQALVVDVGQGILELVNPVVYSSSGEQASVEHCASFPGTAFRTLRPELLTVEGQDRNGEKVRVEASGLLARILQHELDHLQGVLYYDHLDEEDLFLQIMNAEEEDESTEEEQFEPGNESSSQQLGASDASDGPDSSTKQQVIDMMADASWKFTLAVELLRDLEEPVPEPQVQTLDALADRLRNVTDEMESLLLESPPPG